MVRLTSGDVCDLTGMNRFRLQNWCNRGILNSRSKGEGHHRQFTNVQLLAVAYGFQYVQLGYSLDLATKIIKFICSFSEKRLEAEFKAGRTHLIPIGDMPMSLMKNPEPRTDRCDSIDLSRRYYALLKEIKKRQVQFEKRQEKNSGRGRRCGLAR